MFHAKAATIHLMLRALVLTTLLAGVSAAQSEPPVVLHIKAALSDAAGRATPVSRHALLISDNPATAAPRRIVTAADGTAQVRLRPGSYIVESDRPVSFNGKTYQWTQVVEIVAGRDALLELSASNAEVETTTLDSDAGFLLSKWQDSVVALWTPTTHASGFLINGNGNTNGLIVTNSRVVGTATTVEVQLTPAVKMSAIVLAADAVRDVAVLWIAAKAVAGVRPLDLPCSEATRVAVEERQEVVAIGAARGRPKWMTAGPVSRVETDSLIVDTTIPSGSAGGPVFSSKGDLVGLTSVPDENDPASTLEFRVVRSHRACDVVAAAVKKMTAAGAPSDRHLPVEPDRAVPEDSLKEAASRRAGSLNPYQVSSSTFDVAFITPILTYGTQYQSEQMRRARTTKDTPLPEPALVRPLMEFANWSEYVWEFPPVLLVRVTPKLVEDFWAKIGRAAARTQGVALPPFKRIKSGFGRLRAFCGDTEVTPIHPFKLEHHVDNSDTIYEGLYVYDPAAFGPHCGTVKLEIYSEKEPQKAEARVVDARIIEQVWSDFAPYRQKP